MKKWLDKSTWRRIYQREYRARTGQTGDGSHTLHRGGDVQGMTELFEDLREVEANIAVRARRKALQTTAQELTKAAKQATPRFKLPPEAKATLRRAIYRRDPKTIQRYDKGKRVWRKTRPMSYRVAIRVGKAERAGADLGVFTSGKKKGQSRGVRKHSRDAYYWHWIEKGTKNRSTKRKGGRGRIQAQNVFRDAFDQAQSQAISAGEKAGMAELQKILAKQRAKSGRVKPGIR